MEHKLPFSNYPVHIKAGFATIDVGNYFRLSLQDKGNHHVKVKEKCCKGVSWGRSYKDCVNLR